MAEELNKQEQIELSKEDFSRLVKEYQSSLNRLAQSILLNQHDAEDAVCTAIYKAYINEFAGINDPNLESKREEIEKRNSYIEYTKEIDGVKLTINNIAMDDNFIVITSTVEAQTPLRDILIDKTYYKDFLEDTGLSHHEHYFNYFSPNFLFKVNDEKTNFSLSDNSSYLKDEYKLVSIQKYVIGEEIPDIFNLHIYCAQAVVFVNGDWSFDINIDKSEEKSRSKTITPNITKTIKSVVYEREIEHEITIDKVSISPLGGKIEISEAGQDIFRDFVLKDNLGNYHFVFNESVSYKKNGDIVTNIFEFTVDSSEIEDINELEFIPILLKGDFKEKTVMLSENIEDTDIKISNIGGYRIENIEFNREETKITLKPYGAVLQYRSIINGAFRPVDKEGSQIKFNGLITQKYDKNNGNLIVSYFSTNEETERLQGRLGGFWFVEMPKIEINEKEKIKINFSH
ncbi:DUF4179 domain-containing protein [Sedimentibacter sp.]|uniref:DUF4179 domain-containing protein n=1 Tax=Sedimentibacter sp. TaxID=1960295 RepID=UPI0028A8B81A|nr:DUF4179 domain-containing protein [Sedimentibacter sp.]